MAKGKKNGKPKSTKKQIKIKVDVVKGKKQTKKRRNNRKGRKGGRNSRGNRSMYNQNAHTTSVQKGSIYLGTLDLHGTTYVTATPTVYQRLLNPVTFDGTRIAQIAPAYEKYLYLECNLVYKPIMTKMMGGQAIVYFDTDPLDTQSTDRHIAINAARDMQGSQQFHVAKQHRTRMPRTTVLKSFFIGRSSESVWENQARLFIVQSAPLTNFNGELVDTSASPVSVGSLELQFTLKFLVPHGITGVQAIVEEGLLPTAAIVEARAAPNSIYTITGNTAEGLTGGFTLNGLPVNVVALPTFSVPDGFYGNPSYGALKPAFVTGITKTVADTASNYVWALFKKFGNDMYGAFFHTAGETSFPTFFKQTKTGYNGGPWQGKEVTPTVAALLATFLRPNWPSVEEKRIMDLEDRVRALTIPHAVPLRSVDRFRELERKFAMLEARLDRFSDSEEEGDATDCVSLPATPEPAFLDYSHWDAAERF